MIQPSFYYGLALLAATSFFWSVSSVKAQQLAQWNYDVPVVSASDTLPAPWVGGLNAVQYNTIDINNDDQDDLLLFDRTTNTLLPFLRESNQWIYAPEYAALFPANLQSWVLLKDYNGDGHPDLFTASGSRGISLYQNTTENQGLLSWELITGNIRTIALASGANVTLQVNSSDYPAIVDVDQDGDLDVVNYSVIGSGELLFHQNQSMEQYGNADSLVYQTISMQWGEVEECNCGLFAFGDQTCDELPEGSRTATQAKLQHVGGKALLVLDADGDQDMDVLSGDEGCFGMTFLENIPVDSQVFFQQLTNGYPDNTLPSSGIFFPGAYLADGDGDGVDDLILSPNASTNVGNNIDFKNSSWLYKNEGTAQQPQWQYLSSSFLQEGMIDVGEDAVPALADYDADGDLDLFIGSRGMLHTDGFYAGLYLYENVGNAQQPIFRFVTDDFLQLSNWKAQEIKPYFADINQDGKKDLLITVRESANRASNLYALLNQARSSDEPYVLVAEQRQVLNLPFRSEDNLAFYDVDQDRHLDVLVGKQSGNLVYYRNQSSAFPPQWVEEDDAFAGIGRNARGLFLAPTVIAANQDSIPQILSSDVSGNLLLRPMLSDSENIKVDTVLTQNALLSTDLPVSLGRQSWLATGQLSGDGAVTVVVGSQRGGVSLLQLSTDLNSGESPSIVVYPNPSDGATIVKTNNAMRSLQVINVAGQLVYDQVLPTPVSQTSFNVDSFPVGLYIVRTLLAGGEAVSTKLLVKH
uniref:T9SS type A sorting domain-containing protein n=1 Tax=Roseihalotalea indica TaxID=2867963 RepID=A0AA49GR74_9BACT|nr:T9SS type A sorting domain-containing protein [Tunicatimonas sp. TK19036]